MANYYDSLKSEKWQHVRRNIILRDGNKCTVCGSNLLLKVHHTFYYENYPEPWKYPFDSLITLCEKCHNNWHEHNEIEIRKKPEVIVKKVKRIIKRNVKGLSKYEISYLSKKGNNCKMTVFAKSELRAVYSNARKIKAVISVKRIKCKG
jgi:hypothetical protein